MIELHNGDCVEMLPHWPGVAKLVIADPPFNLGKADW